MKIIEKPKKPLLCKIGLHKWSRPTFTTHGSSNVKDYSKTCARCNITKRWTKAR
ncbi:MAG: DUF1660 family phage protein [Candidatus Thorarchaeota archaeon]